LKTSLIIPFRGAVFAFLGFVSVLAHAENGVTVTITKKAPIETVSSSGEIAGVAESTVGTKLILISASLPQLTLQDAQGTRFLIAASATDYTPPQPSVPLTSTNTATQVSKPTTNPPPVSPVIAAQPIAPPTPPPVPAEGKMITVAIGERTKDNLVAIWPEGGIPGRPLLVVAHGHGGSGPNEINGWLKLAKMHHFTVVCPTFLSSIGSNGLEEDRPYFRACLSWIKDNLKYDQDNVYMTGMSGGGGSLWYIATQHPDFFRGLFMQSCNFWGDRFELDLGRWFDKPIKLIWGSEDLPDIPVENNQAIEALKAADCKDFTTEIIPGGHHQEHPDLVVSWMEEQMSRPPSN
jgi:dienelactone hydrolase